MGVDWKLIGDYNWERFDMAYCDDGFICDLCDEPTDADDHHLAPGGESLCGNCFRGLFFYYEGCDVIGLKRHITGKRKARAIQKGIKLTWGGF